MIIEARFNGPPGSGNGGWSAGVFAAVHGAATGPAEVTLRRPPPLDTPLRLVDGAVHDPEGALVAQVGPVDDFPAEVPPVDRATAEAAAAAYPGLVDHPFPGCYVCGPRRADGLRIFPGRLPDGRTAAPFRVPADVTPATVWAALDCPGGWAVIAPGRPYVLGRIAVVVDRLPEPGDECVVVGAQAGGEGRKALVSTALYGSAGDLLGHARATWIALPAS
ncbi:hypothetical protein [Micromonospora mirobrigensis]|uniref:Thioesterase-like superfamily protein n=1 Tax=Micromonospora mirobrigensis TaxID=262898 RepID=A0A1C4XS84_9ACTN|nr:hypothetical protein [Micromonospora mirobrigensis]SCF11379.1 hypothetical protein GA0070564_103302 [Micromonospora mirobrigensis]